MRKFLLLFVYLGIIQIGSSLKCYKCNGCENTKGRLETCRNVDPNLQMPACLTQVVRDIRLRDVITVKKCTVVDKNVQYQCASLPESEPMSCKICHENYCNNSATFGLSYFAFTGIFLLYLSKLIVFT